MPAYKYQIRIKAEIELGGTFDANNRDEAIDLAKRELRSQGEISNVVVDECIFLDDEATSLKDLGAPL